MLESVRDIFSKIANDRAGVPSLSRPSAVRVPLDLYFQLCAVYRDTVRLIDQLETVLEDGEHCLVIEEGKALGLKMPDTESFRYRLPAYRAQTRSYSPFEVTRDGDSVYMPIHVARGLYTTALLGISLTHDTFESVLKSDYWKYLRELKQRGAPYAGPACIPEMMSAHITLQIAAQFVRRHALPARLPINWTREPKLAA